MEEGKYVFRAIIMLFIICFMSLPTHIYAVNYPLQVKFPETMIYKMETDKKVIALTFDDGPDERFTPQILDVLNKHQIKATFFLLGSRIEKYAHIGKRIKDEGHVIGNHTYWHPQLTKEEIGRLSWELAETEKVMENMLGVKTNLFRAPYGALNEAHVKKLAELNYKGVGWSVDSEDWRSLPKEEVKQNILAEIHPGAIVLMHSAGHWTQDLTGTVEALDEIIVYLKSKEYRFITVPEMWETIYK